MRFFFYGTLLDDSDNAVAAWLHQRLRPLAPASVRGRLHAVPNPAGWYPALLAGEDLVSGRLYEADGSFGAADLARLDAYEDYDPARPVSSLYLREPLAVIDAQGTCQDAHAYRFNQALPDGAVSIPGGDFRAWLSETGFGEFRGLR